MGVSRRSWKREESMAHWRQSTLAPIWTWRGRFSTWSGNSIRTDHWSTGTPRYRHLPLWNVFEKRVPNFLPYILIDVIVLAVNFTPVGSIIGVRRSFKWTLRRYLHPCRPCCRWTPASMPTCSTAAVILGNFPYCNSQILQNLIKYKIIKIQN